MTTLVVGAKRREPERVASAAPTAVSPSELAPALVAKLLGRGRSYEWAEATILDLGRRGALSLEPAGGEDNKVRVRLLDGSVPRFEHERRVWAALERASDEGGVIPEEAIRRLSRAWEYAGKALDRDLSDSGLLDPQAVTRREWIYVAGVSSLVLGLLALGLIASAGRDPWSSLATVVPLVGGLGAIAYNYYGLRGRTAAGEREAARWRGYLSGITSFRGKKAVGIDLERAIPYATASGQAQAVEWRLEEASEWGQVPSWFADLAGSDRTRAGDLFSYWLTFHYALQPAYAGGTGAPYIGAGGAAGGGASAGGAGAGGGF